MKKAKLTVPQIVGIVREAEALLETGKTVAGVCRHLKIGASTYQSRLFTAMADCAFLHVKIRSSG